MRIAFVSTSYPAFPGDPSGHFVETEAKQAALGDEVFVVTAAAAPLGAPCPSPTSSPTVLRLPGHGAFGWPGVASRIGRRPYRALGAWLWARDATRALTELMPLDRVVAHWALPSAWPIANRLDVPVEIVSHGADVRLLVALPGPLRREILGRLLAPALAWRFVSTSLLASLLACLDREDACRVEAIARVEAPIIEVPDVAAEARQRRSAHRGVDLAVCVGRLVRSKRVDQVVDFVAREGKPTTRLIVVGDGPLRAVLARHARARGVDALFVGQTSRHEALTWIAAAEVVLHASTAEGLSTVEREARALGVPFRFVGSAPAAKSRGHGMYASVIENRHSRRSPDQP
jgi:teichuronic acid biosynthesis glycosyltransferase TuaC